MKKMKMGKKQAAEVKKKVTKAAVRATRQFPNAGKKKEKKFRPDMKEKGTAKMAKPQSRVDKKPQSKNAPKALPSPIEVMSRKLTKPSADSALGKAIAEKMKQKKK